MEEALVSRLRNAAAIANVAGAYQGRPAIDWVERQSDDAAAFPAITMQKVSPGRTYEQDGPIGLIRPRVRFEVYGLTYASMKILARALTLEVEKAADVDDVRFHRGKIQFDRDFPPEDLGGDIKIFRAVLDFFLPYTPA